jgi:lariat debranching enzyme
MMGLLRTLKPDWWFSAHLHVRFQAVVVHDADVEGPSAAIAQEPLDVSRNEDEIVLDDEEEDVAPSSAANIVQEPPDISRNQDEIILDDEEEDVAPPPLPPPHARRETRFLALDKCLPRREFLEVNAPSSMKYIIFLKIYIVIR